MAETPEKNPKKTLRGRFKPGQSGNPGGRKKLDPEVKTFLAEKSMEAAKKVAALLKSKDDGVALRAAMVILDRVYGKADQSHKVENLTPQTITIVVEDVSKPANN